MQHRAILHVLLPLWDDLLLVQNNNNKQNKNNLKNKNKMVVMKLWYSPELEPKPEPFYFWRVGVGAAVNRAAPQLCFLLHKNIGKKYLGLLGLFFSPNFHLAEALIYLHLEYLS